MCTLKKYILTKESGWIDWKYLKEIRALKNREKDHKNLGVKVIWSFKPKFSYIISDKYHLFFSLVPLYFMLQMSILKILCDALK